MGDLFGVKQVDPSDPESDRYRYRGRSKAHPAAPGSGPEGESCGSCEQLHRLDYHNKVYFKCGFVKWTHGPGTDLRLKDEACRFWSKPEKGEVI